MPDKEQIIIDGVDVSGCKYLDTSIFSGNSYWCHLFHNFCNATNYNYNYIHCFDKCPVYQLSKQLACKTQECEELKKKIETYKCSTNCHKYIEADRYRKALEEIEEVCKNGVYDEFEMPLDECSIILNIINKVDCRQSAECFCEAKHTDTFNADNQAAKGKE